MSDEASDKRAAANQDTFRPIIFVGAGSNGAKIVSRIQERMSRSSDPLIRAFVKYVNITSETRAEPGVLAGVPRRSLASEVASPAIAVERLSSLIQNKEQKSEFTQWWHKEADGSPWVPPVQDVTDGAAGIRSVGRLLLHIKASSQDPASALIGNLRGFAHSIRESWDGLPDHEKANVEKDRILCFVFGVLAGGTCSGMVLDLPLFLRQAWSINENGEEWFRVQLNGIFLLGDVCYIGASVGEQNWLQRKLQIANTRYALAELLLSSTKTGRDILGPQWSRHVGRETLPKDAFRGNAYDSITVVGAKNDADRFYKRFSAYLDFVADFYSSLLESKTLNQQMARIVDTQGNHLPSLEQQRPAEPHNFARIGRLGLRPPTEKSALLLTEHIANSISYAFANADPERDEELPTEFQLKTGAAGWASLLSPMEAPILPPEPLPKKKDEFRQHWNDQKSSLDGHYAGFSPWPEKGTLHPSLVELWSQVKACLDDIVLNTLGQQAGKSFSLGSLAYFEKSISGWLTTRLNELSSRAASLQSLLFGGGAGGESLGKIFEDSLNRQVEDFPEDGVLTFFKRKNWAGNTDVEEALRQYGQSLRELRASEREIAILRLMNGELQKIRLFTKLLGSACLETFKDVRDRTTKEFEEDKSRPEIWVEVLKDRTTIDRVIVLPILEQMTENKERFAEALPRQVLSEWSGGPKSQLMVVWKTCQRAAETMKRVDASGSISLPTQEQIQQVAGVVDQLNATASDLLRCIRGCVDSNLRARIDSLTVWDVLRDHVKELVKQNRQSPSVVLQNLFREYAQKANCFGKISNKAPDVTPFRQEVVCIGVREDADRCFGELGIDQPAYLSTLLADSFGSAFTVNPPATPEGRREFAVFIFRQGGLPVYTEGFVDSKNLLLPAQGAKDGDWNWTDSRFPAWIEQWWTKTAKPDYLNR